MEEAKDLLVASSVSGKALEPKDPASLANSSDSKGNPA
eukprot:CAMPEP_0170499972 /NCGR_PEP_ID=MMETSP0208-20121228/33260_1 /TAXON_ID=197538 /ORGANISM="Strombidium inclinatum, Strain S3" /LENGTH=37 /DNA_ID= /DNA_START= /DNA_END= /DNA_ORIENTATION=